MEQEATRSRQPPSAAAAPREDALPAQPPQCSRSDPGGFRGAARCPAGTPYAPRDGHAMAAPRDVGAHVTVPFPDTVLVTALTGIKAHQLERALSPRFQNRLRCEQEHGREVGNKSSS